MANLNGANFRDADLSGAELRGADLKGIINFADATLYDVNFTGANITKGLVNFRGAKIRNVVGLSADLYI